MVDHKVAFHVDEMEKWNLTLGNVTNFIAATSGQNNEIVVVAYATAVRAYLASENSILMRMQKLSLQGVQFMACNNALRAEGLEGAKLGDFVEIVPAGVVKLVQLQEQGFSYIRP